MVFNSSSSPIRPLFRLVEWGTSCAYGMHVPCMKSHCGAANPGVTVTPAKPGPMSRDGDSINERDRLEEKYQEVRRVCIYHDEQIGAVSALV